MKWLLFLCFLPAYIQGIEIALSFDDFPMHSTSLFECEERVHIFVQKLEECGIQAAFFCIGNQVDQERGQKCLKLIDRHFVANHSYNHLHASSLNLSEFAAELNRTEQLLTSYPNFRKWFRFPYLDYGDRSNLGGSNRKRTALFLCLREAGYQHGYVTINTFDWYINGHLKKAVEEGREVNWEALKTAYLKLLAEWIEGYHNRWSGILKKDFVHILLLHQNDLNALFLKDIVEMCQKKKWNIVSPEKAFNHPIPYLSHFVNQKMGLFKGVPSLSKAYIDDVLLQEKCF